MDTPTTTIEDVTIRYLVEDLKVDVNAGNRTGLFPIILAAQERDSKLIHYLVGHGANPNVADAQGLRPIHYTVLAEDRGRTRRLTMAGADSTVEDVYGRTPLHFATQANDLNIDRKDADGWTLLMWACKRWRPALSIIRTLITDHGADIWALSNDRKWSPLKLARRSDAGDDVKRLLEPSEDKKELITKNGIKKVWDPNLHIATKERYHDTIYCDSCKMYIVGSRYKCQSCGLSFDLCFKCYPNRSMMHDPEHEFAEYEEEEELERTLSKVSGSSGESVCREIEREEEEEQEEEEEEEEEEEKEE
ncbi:hypothetical protein H9Q74_013106 [Fusarium xylarioides]|nr:hypothetical protein H9Q74_013106 [Fusarium xylarioides]